MAKDNPLGRNTPVSEHYDPGVLYPIPRREGRSALGLAEDQLPFGGEDLWHAWEVSWLGPGGKPQMRVGRLRFPCDSPCLVESKSLKLYLNSLNQTEFADEEAVAAVIRGDLESAAGAPVGLELLSPDSEQLRIHTLPGSCIDGLQPTARADRPDPALLRTGQQRVSETLNSQLMRSLCPVTAQPDWASLVISYEGPEILPRELLAYLLSYRSHPEFHEQCVERIFCDLLSRCEPERLSVQALYTRRGGLDINPFRCTGEGNAEFLRCARQ